MTQPLPQAEAQSDAGLIAVFIAMRSDLMRFLAARNVSADAAEDVLQDAFLTIKSRVRGPVSHPRAYLYRMVDNLLLDRRRGETRRLNRETRWVNEEVEEEADERSSPERQMVAKDRLKRISDMIDALPERTGLILRQFRLEGVPQARIAAELGISVSAVEKHLQRAYQAILAADLQLDAEPAALRRPSHDRDPHERN